MSKRLTIILGAIGSLIANVIWLLVSKAILNLGIISIIVLIILIVFEFILVYLVYHKIKQKNELYKILTQHEQERSDKEIELSKSQNYKTSICNFLDDIEKRFNEITLFHLPKPAPLKDQYIPIQVTLERKFRHDVETFTGYFETDDENKHAYAYRGINCESEPTQISWEEARKKNKRIMVLADPGMGKSTLLKMEAVSNAHSERERLSNGEIAIDNISFPILLRLYDLSERVEEVFDAVIALVQRDYPKTSKDIIDLLRNKLDDGKCVLLLDALDEVPGERRNELSQKLDRFTQNYKCSIICTSRIVGYGGSFLTDSKEVEIVPFSQKQTEEYIRTWFNLADIKDESISADGLIRELKDKPQVQGLAQNPLLLSLICSLYQEKKISLPARRCEIYEKAVDYILGEWREKKKPQLEGMKEAKKELLEYLAYKFTCQSKEIFSLNEIRKQIEEYLSSDEVLSDFKDYSSSKLINEFSFDDGIIPKADKEGDRYMFLHRTFQEYLTASYMKRNNGIELAKEHFWEYDWHETLSLLAGLMDDPIPLLQTIMDEKDDIFFSMLLLAYRCVAECKEDSHQLLTEIAEKTYALWKSSRYHFLFDSAVVMMGKISKLIFEKLINALGDKDRYVRSSAVDALGKIGSEKAVPALIKALEDSDVRSSVTSALGKIGSEKAVPALIKALEDSDVRNNATDALGKVDSETVDALNKAFDGMFVRSNAASALGEIGSEKAVPALVDALNKTFDDMFVRSNAASALDKIGSEKAVPALINALEDKDSNVRENAADALGKIGSERAVPALINALGHEDSDVRSNAADALGKIGSEKAMDALINALSHEDSDVRWKAASALHKIGSKKAVDALIKTLGNNYVRRNAISALGKTGSEKTVDAIIKALDDKDRYVRMYAVSVLGKIGSEKAVDALIKALNHEDSYVVKWNAASALGEIGSEKAIDALIKALDHEDSDVKKSAASALGEIGSEKAVDALIKALNDKDDYVRTYSASALGEIGSEKAVNALIKGLDHEDSNVRRNASYALGKIGTSEILMELISNPEIDIYDEYIFNLARKLAIKFSTSEAKRKDKPNFIPVYPELVAHEKKLGTGFQSPLE